MFPITQNSAPTGCPQLACFGKRGFRIFLEGDVEVIPSNGNPVKVGKGDLVKFLSMKSCFWKVYRYVKKHYSFG